MARIFWGSLTVGSILEISSWLDAVEEPTRWGAAVCNWLASG